MAAPASPLMSLLLVRRLVLPVLCVGVVASVPMLAQTPDSNPAAPAASPAVGTAPVSATEPPDDNVFTPAREAAALTFAQLHHPELAQLLEGLKASSKNKKKYEQAIHDLFRTSERLARLQAKSPERGQDELNLWKLDSRIRLAAARQMMKGDMARREELRQLIAERVDLRLASLEAERLRLMARLTRLDTDLATMKSTRDSRIDDELKRLVGKPASRSTPRKKDERPTKAAAPAP